MAGGAPGIVREFHFTNDDFEQIRKLIYQHAGISLAPIKKDMVYSRLARRLRALRLETFAEYLAHLQAGGATEVETFVNSLTTNLTSFFREGHHFDLLHDQMLNSPVRPFRIWCAASSTGEEAYSLAITACEAFDSLTPPVAILASDIDTNVLNIAREGIYPVERVDKLPTEQLRRFFLRGAGQKAGYARVRPELRELLTFTRINLLDTRWPMHVMFDAIFCRNVMIYFDRNTQYQILQRFKPYLRPEGKLYAGHSESFLHAADLFRSRGRTVYEHTPPG